ncbi:MAG: hypothetical protein LBN23_08490 [Paludibacter sp.]|jgi:hypothetical protein|nr:hypothetical protein [Paludibacter sp.]
MKKIKFFFYSLILLGTGFISCDPGIPIPPELRGSNLYKVQFDPIELYTGTSQYETQQQQGVWGGAVIPANTTFTNFWEVFDRPVYPNSTTGINSTSYVYDSWFKAKNYSSKSNAELTSNSLSVWFILDEAYSPAVQSVTVAVWSGPYKNNAGQTGNLYWLKSMNGADYDISDVQNLITTQFIDAGEFKTMGAFKAISSGGGSSGGSSGSGSGSGSGGIIGGSGGHLSDGTAYILDDSDVLYILDDNDAYIANRVDLYILDNATSVLVDAHYRTSTDASDASVSDAVMPEGTLTVYRRVSADTQISQ